MPNIQVISKKEAILASIRGNWKEPDEELDGIWSENELLLPDFRYLALYLAKSSMRESDGGRFVPDIARSKTPDNDQSKGGITNA